MKVQCSTLLYIDEVLSAIAAQQPLSSIKSSILHMLSGLQIKIDGASGYIELLERIIAAIPPLLQAERWQTLEWRLRIPARQMRQ